MTEETTKKLVVIRWPLSSLSSYHFLVLPPFFLPFFDSPLLLTTVCCYSIAYTFYKIALSRCSLCRSRTRALYFRTSNYRNNIHTQCCYATEPICCCSKNMRRLLAHTPEKANIFSDIACKWREKKRNDENLKHNCYTNKSITEWRLPQLDL